MKRYEQERLQQAEEAELAKEQALVAQGQRLVEAQVEVVKMTTEATKRQEVALEEANRDRSVAEKKLQAAKDLAAAMLAEKSAEASVIQYANEAEAAGWKRSIASLGGNGDSYAQYTLFQKLAPSYQSITTNTADSPLMKVFEEFTMQQAQQSTERGKIEVGPMLEDTLDLSVPDPAKQIEEAQKAETQNDSNDGSQESSDPVQAPVQEPVQEPVTDESAETTDGPESTETEPVDQTSNSTADQTSSAETPEPTHPSTDVPPGPTGESPPESQK